MVRPPPLRLRLDNWYPDLVVPHHSASVPNTSFVRRLYNRSWRAPVLLVAIINVFRYLHCADGTFNDFLIDKHLNISELAILSFLTGVIYVTLSIVELFGILANALPRRLHLIETYARLVYTSAVLVAICGLIQTGSYLVYKRELIEECEYLFSNDKPLRTTFRAWSIDGSSSESIPQECRLSYSASTFTFLLSFPLSYLLPIILQLILVYTYSQQSIDPLHASNLCYQHQNSRSAGPGGYHRLLPTTTSSSSSNRHSIYATNAVAGWFSFSSRYRPSLFSRFHAFITRSNQSPKYQAVPISKPKPKSKSNSRNSTARSTKKVHVVKKSKSMMTVSDKQIPRDLSTPETLMTPGPPSFGGGPGGLGRHQESLYGFYGGRLSAFTIGSAETEDEDHM